MVVVVPIDKLIGLLINDTNLIILVTHMLCRSAAVGLTTTSAIFTIHRSTPDGAASRRQDCRKPDKNLKCHQATRCLNAGKGKK